MTEDCLFHLELRYLRGLQEGLRRAIRMAEEEKHENAKKIGCWNGKRSYEESAG
ncbi:MAG: hypothetical protein ACE5JU_18050 [Candidatus Binatia bacterium]